MAKGRSSSRSTQSRYEVVTRELSAGIPLNDFLAGIEELTHDERALIVQQAIMVLEGLHVNLPLKCAMYAVDPLRRLRLLQQRLPSVFSTDRLFHREMTQIFNSLNDLHANYLLPSPFDGAIASLPFTVESCYQGDRRKYLVTEVTGDTFDGTAFRKGVEILDWNGVPIARAMEMIGAQSPSGAGNLAARHALGVYTFTARPLNVLMPPDEEWVVVGYRTGPGKKRREIRSAWSVSGVSTSKEVPHRGSVLTHRIQELRKLRSAPAEEKSFRAREVTTPYGKFGLLRIFTFDKKTVVIDDLIKGIKSLPENGLIVDVRENNGGRTATAEQLLQVISPNYPQHAIEPERLCFINTPRTLELCELQKDNPNLGPSGLQPWIESIERAMQTGATFSASFPYTDPRSCNVKGRLRYPGPVIVVTDGLTRSAAEVFAAGFQDHGGSILGVDEVTAGAGSNARFHFELSEYFKEAQRSPFKTLPKNAGILIPFRRFQRVGPQAGNEIEDFGVRRNYCHRMTRDDVLNDNVDLYNHAASILVSKDFGAHKRRV